MSVFYIHVSVILICIYFHSIVYRGNTLNYYCEKCILKTNYSQNTHIFNTYYHKPFHNKYKSDVRLLHGILLQLHFGYDGIEDHCIKV